MPALLLLVSLLQTLSLPGTSKHLAVFTSTSAATAAASSKVTLYVDVTPNPGIHVYAPGAKDYIPVALKLDETPNAVPTPVRYPKSQTLTFEGEKVPVYDKPFRLEQVVTLAPSLKAGETLTVTGKLSYQACDDRVCFIPATVALRWTIAVADPK